MLNIVVNYRSEDRQSNWIWKYFGVIKRLEYKHIFINWKVTTEKLEQISDVRTVTPEGSKLSSFFWHPSWRYMHLYIYNLTSGEYKIGKSQTPGCKISIVPWQGLPPPPLLPSFSGKKLTAVLVKNDFNFTFICRILNNSYSISNVTINGNQC